MVIEDYILGVSGYGKWAFQNNSVAVAPQDAVFFESVAAQLSAGSALTEKQGTLAVKLLRKYTHRFDTKMYPTARQDLENPQWKAPFRVLPVNKTITIEKHNKFGKIIHLEFPFDEKLVTHIKSWNKAQWNRGQWDPNIRKWEMTLREDNILMIGDQIISEGFNADEEFHSFYNTADSIRNQIEDHLPMVVNSDIGYRFINHHIKIPQLDTTDVVEALYTARDYGITTWDDVIESKLTDPTFNKISRCLLKYTDGEDYLWLHRSEFDIKDFDQLLTYGGPALVIIPGGTEYGHIKEWHECAVSMGIPEEQMSVMFRLPNSDAEFNRYVKDHLLNNPVTDATRIVFVSTKIPKPLIKSGVKFNTVINLGFFDSMHYTMSSMIASARNLVYYSIKEPSKIKKWLQLR